MGSAEDQVKHAVCAITPFSRFHSSCACIVQHIHWVDVGWGGVGGSPWGLLKTRSNMPSVASQPLRRITTSLLLVMPSISLHAHHHDIIHSLNQLSVCLFDYLSISCACKGSKACCSWSCRQSPCMHIITHACTHLTNQSFVHPSKV